MSKKKQVLLALAREVVALYSDQSLPRTRSGVQEGRIVLLGSRQK